MELEIRQIKEKNKLAKKEFKSKITEFLKKYYAYDQIDTLISDKVKQELKELGAFKPFYAESENSRVIRLIDLWKSNNKELKNIVFDKAQKHFLMESDKLETFLNDIYDNFLKKRELAKNMRNSWKKK